jgi:hypothetical protein
VKSAFERFDEILSAPGSADFFPDEIAGAAVTRLNAFQDPDWDQFRAQWAQRPAAWQILAAEAMSDQPDPRARPVVMAMIESAEPTVQVVACDVLRNHLAAQAEPYPVAPRILEIIDGLLENASGLESWSLEKLQTMLVARAL